MSPHFSVRLKLQYSFKEEGKLKQGDTSLTNLMKPGIVEQKSQKLKKIQKQRTNLAPLVLQELLLKLFVRILQDSKRSSGLIGL